MGELLDDALGHDGVASCGLIEQRVDLVGEGQQVVVLADAEEIGLQNGLELVDDVGHLPVLLGHPVEEILDQVFHLLARFGACKTVAHRQLNRGIPSDRCSNRILTNFPTILNI